MDTLSTASLCIGLLAIAAGVAALAAGPRLRAVLAAFPRSRVPGWVLGGVDVAWATWALHRTDLGRFETLRPLIYVGGPVALFLILRYLDELLAPRALGALLLLLANPLLAAARWHPSAASRVVVLLAYAWVVAGMTLVLNPWWFRRALDWFGRDPRRWQAAALAKVAAGLGLVALALAVF